MDRLKELKERLQELDTILDADETTLGKADARREMTVDAAVAAADELLLSGSVDGSDVDMLTAIVAERFTQKIAMRLRMHVLANDIMARQKSS